VQIEWHPLVAASQLVPQVDARFPFLHGADPVRVQLAKAWIVAAGGKHQLFTGGR